MFLDCESMNAKQSVYHRGQNTFCPQHHNISGGLKMDFRQIAMMQKIKSGMDRFRANHPKFPMFLRAVSQDALVEGTIIEINVTTPEGKNYCTNVKLKADDMELFDSFKNMQG